MEEKINCQGLNGDSFIYMPVDARNLQRNRKKRGSFWPPKDAPRGRRLPELGKFSGFHGRQQHLAFTRVVAAFSGADAAETNIGTVPIG